MTQPHATSQISRRDAMSVLAHAPTEWILACLKALDVPPYEAARQPESGLVMVRGRIGGDGAPFNLGEASVSRAAVRLASGELGFGYVLGRDGEKARLIALCDALIQNSGFKADVEQKVIEPLRCELEAARNQQAAETAATRVDFYTLVRGEG
ncbi:MAG: phosphonate C-P lyase system protein PhnG [Afipia sp.]|nr:phosphonate C-P lyase system protein PhnG [Afipia sp.]